MDVEAQDGVAAWTERHLKETNKDPTAYHHQVLCVACQWIQGVKHAVLVNHLTNSVKMIQVNASRKDLEKLLNHQEW